MIDYLEDLLEEEIAVELTGAVLAPVGRQRVPLWEEDAEPDRDRKGSAQLPGGEDVLASEGEAGLPWAGRPSWGEETVMVGTGGAVRLLERLARTSLAAEGLRRQGQPFMVEAVGGAASSAGLDLETIDRAVQRDARRYDGGFPLY